MGDLGTEVFWICENPDGSRFPAWRHIILSQLFRGSPSLSKTRDQDSRVLVFFLTFLCFPHLTCDSYLLPPLGLTNDFVKSKLSFGSVSGELERRERADDIFFFPVITSRGKITKEKVK